MHSAPQVTYPVGRSAFLGLALVAAWAAGAAGCGYWIFSAPVSKWRVLLVVVALLLSGCAAARSWYTSPTGQLTWDGQLWRWHSAGYAAGESALDLVIALDLQRVLWLRLQNSAGASLWLWAEKSALPFRWMDLRRAVCSAADMRDVTAASADTAQPGSPASLHSTSLAVSAAALPP